VHTTANRSAAYDACDSADGASVTPLAARSFRQFENHRTLLWSNGSAGILFQPRQHARASGSGFRKKMRHAHGPLCRLAPKDTSNLMAVVAPAPLIEVADIDPRQRLVLVKPKKRR